jgi:hypothetical protein
MVGDANNIVSDAADNRTNVAKFLILVFMKHCEFVDFLRGSRGTNGAYQQGEKPIFTLFA